MRVVYSGTDGNRRERMVLTTELPPEDLCSAVVVLAFKGDRLLLNENKKWGWALPAGHIEKNETIEEAACREVYEETQAKLGRMGALGYWHYRILGPKPAGYKYPYPDSYMVYFWAQIEKLDPFQEDEETSDRRLLSLSDLRDMPDAFSQIGWDAYAAGFLAATGRAVSE